MLAARLGLNSTAIQADSFQVARPRTGGRRPEPTRLVTSDNPTETTQMLPFHLDDASLQRRPTLLALGAHSDDIEIGCGGTLLHLAETYPNLEVVWVVLSATTPSGLPRHERAPRHSSATSRRCG